MRLAPWGLIVAVATSGCGLFFDDRASGGGGNGGGGGSVDQVSSAVATGGNTGGGGADAGGCVVLRACTGAEGGAWGFTFAAAEVEDVSYGPDDRVYFAGSGLPDVAGGLLEHAPGSAPRYYVADASDEGCDVRVCDLGPATGTGDDIRLSHGGTGEVFVAWTQDNRYCARAAASTEPPAASCDETASIFCESVGQLRHPGIISDPSGMAHVATFRVVESAPVGCRYESETASSFSADTPTSYAWSSLSQSAAAIGTDVDAVRSSWLSTGVARVTGHCRGGMVGSTGSCPSVSTGFLAFQADLVMPSPAVINPAILKANPEHTSESLSAYPTTNGWVGTFPGNTTDRFLEWRQRGSGDTIGSQPTDRLEFRSAEVAPLGMPDLFVASGTSDVDITLGCPFMSCTPGITYAFYAVLMHDFGMRGGTLPVQGAEACRGARASGAHQLDDDTVIVGGDYACGTIYGLPTTEPLVTAGNDRAMFLARMPAP